MALQFTLINLNKWVENHQDSLCYRRYLYFSLSSSFDVKPRYDPRFLQLPQCREKLFLNFVWKCNMDPVHLYFNLFDCIFLSIPVKYNWVCWRLSRGLKGKISDDSVSEIRFVTSPHSVSVCFMSHYSSGSGHWSAITEINIIPFDALLLLIFSAHSLWFLFGERKMRDDYIPQNWI